jgi:hypothetical protein
MSKPELLQLIDRVTEQLDNNWAVDADDIRKLVELIKEIPSNFDIEGVAMLHCGGCSPESVDERIGFISGAKWMRYEILGKI